MIRKQISSLIFGLLFLFSGSLPAQNEKYDAVYEKLIKEYTLNVDGSMSFRYIKQQKLQTYRAFHNLYGETFIVYDTVNQKLKINEVYTIMADGKKVPAPENAFNLVLPGYAANAPDYNHLREMVITHTGLERNATVNLDYEVKSKWGSFPFLTGNEVLAEQEPVKNLEIRVKIPVGARLYYQVFNKEIKPVQVMEKEYQVYTWKLADVAAISAEEGQPGNNAGYPRLIFSTSDKMEDACAFLTGQPAFGMALPEEAKSSLATLRSKAKGKFELALAIQAMVIDDLRLYPVPFRVAMYKCRTAEQSWNSLGATVVEKAVLMAAMLQNAGFDAHVAAVVRTAYHDDKIATLNDVEDFVVNVEFKEEGSWFFSVTTQNSVNLKKILPGRSFVVFGQEGKTTVIEADPSRHLIKVIGNFVISSDPKLNGEVSLYFEGAVYPFAGLSRDINKMRNALSGSLIKNDTNNLKKRVLNNENGFQIYIVQSDKPMKKDTNFYFFNLPVVTTGIENWYIRTLSEKRESPYEIPSVADESYSYTITLPSNLTLFTPVKKQTISNKAGTYTWEVASDKGKVTVKRSLKFNEQRIPVDIYPEFKLLMDGWNNPWYKALVFKQL